MNVNTDNKSEQERYFRLLGDAVDYIRSGKSNYEWVNELKTDFDISLMALDDIWQEAERRVKDNTVSGMTIEEIVKALEDKYEVTFVFNERTDEYVSHISNKEEFTIGISHYRTYDDKTGTAFISCDYHSGSSGYGSPVDSIEGVYFHMEKHFEPRAQMTFFDKLNENEADYITEKKLEQVNRYSDVLPYPQRRFWYFTLHGLGPSTIPKDLNILEARSGKNKKGTDGTYVCLDGVCNTSELKEYDLIELIPPEVSLVVEAKDIVRNGGNKDRWVDYKLDNLEGWIQEYFDTSSKEELKALLCSFYDEAKESISLDKIARRSKDLGL